MALPKKGAASKGSAKRTVMKAKKVAKVKKNVGSSRGTTIARQAQYKRKNWAKRLVFFQKKGLVKTSGGLKKRDLVRNRAGKVVSKRKSAIGVRRYHENHIDLWAQALTDVRAEMNVTGWLLCKKAGTKQERDLFRGTESKWKQAVRDRMVQMVSKLDGPGRRTLLTELSDTSNLSGDVKVEGAHLFKQGDRVKLKGKGDGRQSTGKVGVVERYQLGRWCINFQGDLQSVKAEEIERIG
mmetsp:Transcript_52252/g.150477  ORF Transcript_52252/g.150477 Transcript_52252/m.150477 type:complete len:239 (+) Transcript_52252:68-784(+)